MTVTGDNRPFRLAPYRYQRAQTVANNSIPSHGILQLCGENLPEAGKSGSFPDVA